MRRYFGAILLSAALLTPIAGMAADDDHKDKDHRYYDRSNKDYHAWNNNEDQAYRKYLQEQHRDYRDFNRANKRDQDNYWKWRHAHPDDDRR